MPWPFLKKKDVPLDADLMGGSQHQTVLPGHSAVYAANYAAPTVTSTAPAVNSAASATQTKAPASTNDEAQPGGCWAWLFGNNSNKKKLMAGKNQRSDDLDESYKINTGPWHN